MLLFGTMDFTDGVRGSVLCSYICSCRREAGREAAIAGGWLKPHVVAWLLIPPCWRLPISPPPPHPRPCHRVSAPFPRKWSPDGPVDCVLESCQWAVTLRGAWCFVSLRLWSGLIYGSLRLPTMNVIATCHSVLCSKGNSSWPSVGEEPMAMGCA